MINFQSLLNFSKVSIIHDFRELESEPVPKEYYMKSVNYNYIFFVQ